MAKVARPHITVSDQKPPVWPDLVNKFGVKWETEGGKAVVVAYGDTIHCSQEPSDDVIQHELIHLEQQGYTKDGAKKWYERYIAEPEFRLDQELQAYRAQYKFAKDFVKDRNKLNTYLNRLARDLSGEMYGNLVTGVEARRLIRSEDANN